MALTGRQTCFILTLIGAIVSTLVYVFIIKPNITANYSPTESNCINQSVRKCRNTANVMQRMDCMRKSKEACLAESYTTTSMIKNAMIQNMPHGLATSDNRDIFKEGCCGM